MGMCEPLCSAPTPEGEPVCSVRAAIANYDCGIVNLRVLPAGASASASLSKVNFYYKNFGFGGSFDAFCSFTTHGLV